MRGPVCLGRLSPSCVNRTTAKKQDTFSFVRTTLPAVFFCAILTIPSPASSSAMSGSPHLSRILSCTLTAHIVSAEVSRSPHPCPLCNDSVVLPSWNEHLPPPLSVKILLFPWVVKRRSFHRQSTLLPSQKLPLVGLYPPKTPCPPVMETVFCMSLLLISTSYFIF